ncbi:CPBP family intramembrane glutamic endopeptidase [Isoptericola sediminis]|uniref:CPBP family intramembrane metalloprotease n=1 Tax=Isoptericola sediminis TaxID=2733572 RepID=A0A849K3X0_9MICO|nr:CPBP family intramembrane glutamic endopeptidase [Isoptericola sediminis]NNU26739.1 CPBP family intramembrane metalloprotease [Isoptericola sediminis]
MATTDPTGSTESRTAQEPATRDFPFYAGDPVLLRGPQWAVVLVGVAVAFVLLILLPVPGAPLVGQWVRALLFAGVPLAALAVVAGRHWTALFHRVGWKDVGIMVAFAAFNVVVTLVVGGIVRATVGAATNAAGAEIQEMGAGERVLRFASMVPQLVGEELLTILPFLALLYLGVTRLGWSRRATIVTAWIGTALLFGAVHLPTYDWNVVQCFVVIGTARLILTIPYLLTKNLWVCAGAHVLNDWTLFGVGLLGAGVPLLAG